MNQQDENHIASNQMFLFSRLLSNPLHELRATIDSIVSDSEYIPSKRLIDNLTDLAKYKYNKMLSKSLNLLVLKYEMKFTLVHRGKSTQVSFIQVSFLF